MGRVVVLHVSEGGAEGGVWVGPGSPIWPPDGIPIEDWVRLDGAAQEMARGLVARLRRGEVVRLLTPDLSHPAPYGLANLLGQMAGKGDVQMGYSREAFLNALHAGSALQGMVAAYLRARGIRAYAEPYTVVPQSMEAIEEMTRLGVDVYVRLPTGWWGVEVKGSSRRFHGPMDYSWDWGILDTAGSYRAKRFRLLAYVIVSIPTGGMIALPPDGEYQERRIYDRKKGIWDTFITFSRSQIRSMDWVVGEAERLSAPPPTLPEASHSARTMG